MKTFEEFEKFKEEMVKAAFESRKTTKATEEEKIAEMENLRDRYISEIAQELWYIFDTISFFLDSFRFFCGNDGLVITRCEDEVSIVINGKRIAVYFEDEDDVIFEFYGGRDVRMLSQQLKLLRDIEAFLNKNIDNIMASALKQCRKAYGNDVADTDKEVRPVYHHVAIDMIDM